MNNGIAINIEDLHKSYDDVKAVQGIRYNIRKGEMFGLVGPDGAGKTTTIRMLCGLVKPDSGSATLLDMDIVKDKNKIKDQIGYLSQRFSLYGDLTIDENIEFFAEIHNVKNFEDRRNELLEFTRLTPFRDRLADNLSGGMKQKLALACSLIHKPQILFLDEPTTGVDPVSRRDFWKILSSLLKEGITVFMSTPYLDEAERCNRVALMHKGKIISLDTPVRIKESINVEIAEIVCTRVRDANKLVKEKLHNEVQLFGDRINVVLDKGDNNLEQVLKLLESNSINVVSYRIVPPSLENVFIHYVEEIDETAK
ncbi:MAG: ABC transporter ATP-binding protein [Ignavibacteriaceae bacterium]